MHPSRALRDALWPLVDQGIVSLGAFLANILLAHQLPQEEYGVFALMYGGMLALQLVNASLLLYPLTVRGAVARADDWPQLLGAGLILVGTASVALSVVLGATILLMGAADLALPAVLYFLSWQMQEAMRRGLFAQFRHRSAILGDAVGYLGQFAALALLIVGDFLSLANALYAMAACCLIGALLQTRSAQIDIRNASAPWPVLKNFLQIGRWSLLNNLLSLARMQVFPWLLAALHGPVAAASFQAAVNLMNVPNPVLLGLCNIVPQRVAERSACHGSFQAWRMMLGLLTFGAIPVLVYYAVVAALPTFTLTLFYSAESPYADLWMVVQIMSAAWAINYVPEMVCAYLHGIDGSHSAMIVNAAGLATAVLAGVPATLSLGLIGSCLALVAAAIVRTVAALLILARIRADERAVPA